MAIWQRLRAFVTLPSRSVWWGAACLGGLTAAGTLGCAERVDSRTQLVDVTPRVPEVTPPSPPPVLREADPPRGAETVTLEPLPADVDTQTLEVLRLLRDSWASRKSPPHTVDQPHEVDQVDDNER